MKVGKGPAKRKLLQPDHLECAASAPADQGLACRKGDCSLHGLPGLEWPWSWEADYPCSIITLRRQFHILGEVTESVSLSWRHSLLGFYKVLCLWIYGSPFVIVGCLGKQITYYAWDGTLQWRELYFKIQKPQLWKVGKRKNKFWDSLKVNHYTFQCFFFN